MPLLAFMNMEVHLLLLILEQLQLIAILMKKTIYGWSDCTRYQYFNGSLYSRASKLPRIEIARPDGGVIGKNTVSAMQSGIVYGYVGQVEGIVKRMKTKVK